MILAKVLSKNIPKLAKKRNLSYLELEQQAGLHKNYISNLLGRNFTPGVDAMIKIADALKISLDDLVGRSRLYIDQEVALPDDEIELDLKLLENCTVSISKLLKTKDQEISFNKCLYLIKEIYLYCLYRNEKKLDTKFANWFIDRALE